MDTQDLVAYYANLLIMQYIGKPNAYATVQSSVTPILMPQTSVQTIALSVTPTSGSFIVSYGGNNSAAINWNDSIGTISTKITAISGLSTSVITGSITSLLITVTFVGIVPPAGPLSISSNSLLASATTVSLTVSETDMTLPNAVLNGYNFTIGSTIASGVQLDIIGKYAGVTRSGFGFSSNIVLSDADFISLIRMAIFKNSAGSSLYTIQQFLFDFFPGQILVFDYQDMTMSYLISSGVGSSNLIQLFITEGLLPKPMAVLIRIIAYAPTINFFQFRTYENPAVNGEPFNNYASYQTDWPWFTYADVITP